ncbi:MAG: SulP family inorganic anion transporter [Thermomicrobiales bacterium]
MIAIQQAARAGLLRGSNWPRNLVAGLIVGVVALPLSMAFAIASGVTPQMGLYTAIVAAIVVSLFGGSLVQIAGPTGAFIVVLAGITAKHGIDGLQIATLMAGVMLVAMGLARFGAVLKFIPAPVIVGFTAGIGIIIFTGQWHNFLGLPKPEGEHFHEKMISLFSTIGQIHWPTAALATACLLAIVLTPRIPGLKRVPGPMVALLLGTGVMMTAHPAGIATIGTAFGGIPTGLPSFSPPPVTFGRIIELLGPAFTIAMLGAIESLLSATVADGMAGTRHDPNQELTGQGVANVACALLGGFAATGAIARTATNIRNGGNSPIAGITHSVVLIAVLLALAPLAANIPLAALAAILFIVAWNMSEVRHVVSMTRRAPMADVAILWVTLLLTVFADLVVAVNVGVILATLHFLNRMAGSVEVSTADLSGLDPDLRDMPPDTLVYQIEGPLFFAAVEPFQQALAATHTDPKTVILRLGRAPFMDITGLQALRDAVADLHRRGVRVIICEANGRVRLKLDRAGVLELIGDGNATETIAEALALAREGAPVGLPA